MIGRCAGCLTLVNIDHGTRIDHHHHSFPCPQMGCPRHIIVKTNTPPPTKVLFLDFDGVIRLRPAGEGLFMGSLIEHVATVLDTTGAQLVISSDWRRDYDHLGIARLLHPQIAPHHFAQDWQTPRHTDSHHGNEIQDWLDAHPSVNAYAILDDQAWQFEHMPALRANLILCSNRHGFVRSLIDVTLHQLSCTTVSISNPSLTDTF